MTIRTDLLRLALLAAGVAGCRCDPELQRIDPTLGLGATELEYGVVKVATEAEASLPLLAQVRSPVTLHALYVEGAGEPPAFELVDPPVTVPELSEVDVVVRFRPTGPGPFEATLVVESDDPERPELRVPLRGEGAHPELAVVPGCDPADRCRATVQQVPPAIDFGEEPLERAVPLPPSELPWVRLRNVGLVPLVISSLDVEGPDAAAFTLEGAGAPLLPVAAGGELAVRVRFRPLSEGQLDYASELVVRSDDPAAPEVRVELVGALGLNLPPRVCANIIRVAPQGEPELRYDTPADWAPLLEPPVDGYDFRATRDVRPLSVVRFSAFSDPDDDRECTMDPEDRRLGLTFQWTVTGAPALAGTVALQGAAGPLPSFVPVVAGEYEVTLAVADVQGHTTTTRLRFAVVLKRDLSVQLSWSGGMKRYAGVDLDVHLVRPSATTAGEPFTGLFDWFELRDGLRTSGDLNGYAWSVAALNAGEGFGFDWGEPGTPDDPRLHLDEDGAGDLVELVSLNYPANDPACATSDCVYKVFVHYFADRRSHASPAACAVGGACGDGESCDCAIAGDRCVASSAPPAAAPVGTGTCLPAPAPVIEVYFGTSAAAAATIPLPALQPPDELLLGAPCHALYVADIVWPARDGSGTAAPSVVVQGADAEGRIVSPAIARFGQRQAGVLQCAPNAARGGATQPNWYVEAPR